MAATDASANASRGLLRLEGVGVGVGDTARLRDVSLELPAGGTLAVLGSSGAGKSTLLRAVIDLFPPLLERRGTVHVSGVAHDLSTAAGRRAIHRRRGAQIGWMPQAAQASLDPLRTVGAQLRELLQLHRQGDDVTSRLASVALPPDVATLRPDELSGGMARRVALALALAARPPLLLVDEPLAGLDNHLARDILDLVFSPARSHAVVMATHDLPSVVQRCERYVVLERGELVDQGATTRLLASEHPSTRALVDAARQASDATEGWWR